MNYKHIALAFLSSSMLYAHTTFFAPYDGPFPVSIDSRMDILQARLTQNAPDIRIKEITPKPFIPFLRAFD